MQTELRRRLSLELGAEVVGASRLGGGDVAEAFRVELGDGRTVFAKTHADPPPGFFTTEATGLGWLRDVGALPVPEVLAVDDGMAGQRSRPAFLVLEWIDETRRSASEESRRSACDEVAFGAALARLHRAGLPSFGRTDRRTTGSRALPNEPCDTWVEFFRERRLVPLRRLATDAAALPEPTLVRLDDVIERLDKFGVPTEPPARLHGDLWAGNRIVDVDGRSWLIDPAAHGGHREFDLSMMLLFGGFGAEAFAGYAAEWPLAAGFESRVPLHQLAPLIVHAVKFGGGYAAATDRALLQVLAG